MMGRDVAEKRIVCHSQRLIIKSTFQSLKKSILLITSVVYERVDLGPDIPSERLLARSRSNRHPGWNKALDIFDKGKLSNIRNETRKLQSYVQRIRESGSMCLFTYVFVALSRGDPQ